MKINELLAEEELNELDPGQVPRWYDPRKYYGQGKENAQAAKQDKAYSDQIYKQWSSIAVRMKSALKNDPQKNYKEGEYFKSFLSRALRIPANSDAFKKVSAILGANNKNYPKQAKAALDQAVAMRFMAQFPMQGQQGQRQGRNRNRNRNRQQQAQTQAQTQQPTPQPAPQSGGTQAPSGPRP